jgi:thiamine-phosphate pyrophosphorylase
MRIRLPKIYPITDAGVSGLSHAAQVSEMIAGGAELIQIREKSADTNAFFADARNAVAEARRSRARIIINDRVDIALAIGAPGVHLGQDDLPPGAARKLLGNEAIIGFSTHSLDQAVLALREPVDYIAIGPIFETHSKAGPDPVVGLDVLNAVRKAVGDFPLVAIGGIDRSNFWGVLAAGADSVAILSDIASDPPMIRQVVSALLQKAGE